MHDQQNIKKCQLNSTSLVLLAVFASRFISFTSVTATELRLLFPWIIRRKACVILQTVALIARLKLSTVVFLNTQAFCGITMCRMVSTNYPSNRR